MMGRLLRPLLVLGLAAATAACTGKGRDVGFDSHDLSTLKASIWIDPDGCKHWVVDDGLEGYMSPVLRLDGKPDCL